MAEIVDFGLQQHKIKMDSRYFENVLSVVAGDTGRRIEVQLLDTNGMVQDTTGLNLRLNAVVAGKATYTDATLVDAATGKYQLDLSNGMFLAPGNWQFQWLITDAAGKKLHSFAFTGNVGSNISEGGSQATNFYLNLEDLKAMQEDLVNGTFDSEALETNITEKLTDLETQYAPKLTEVTAQLAQTMSQTEFDSWVATLLDGGPSIFMDSLTALTVAYPSGSSGVALVRETNPAKLYVWNGGGWQFFGDYQGLEIKDRSIQEVKLDMAVVEGKRSKNLFDKSKMTIGKYPNAETGELMTNAEFNVSDWIHVEPNETYFVSNPFIIVAYDSNKMYLSSMSEPPFTTPYNAEYVRFGMYANVSNIQQMEIGNSKTSYESYGTKNLIEKIPPIPNEKLQGGITSDKMAFGIIEGFKSKNLFDKSKVTTGKYIIAETGLIGSNLDFSISDFIIVSANTQYVVHFPFGIAVYDDNKSFISMVSEPTFTTPTNAKYVRFAMYNTDLSLQQMELGSLKTSYVPFGNKIDRSQILNIDNLLPYKTLLPSTVYLVGGEKISIFFNNLYKYYQDLTKQNCYIVVQQKTNGIYSVKGQQYNYKWEYTPLNGETNFDMEFRVISTYDGSILASKVVTFIVADSTLAANHGRTANIISVGDSFMDSDVETIIGKLYDNITTKGGVNAVNLLGLHRASWGNTAIKDDSWAGQTYSWLYGTPTGYLRGDRPLSDAVWDAGWGENEEFGWSSGQTYYDLTVDQQSHGHTNNQFYNPTIQKFDFSYYMNTHMGGQHVDGFISAYGLNDVGWVTVTEAKTLIAALIPKIRYIINSVHAYDSNIKVLLYLIPKQKADNNTISVGFSNFANYERVNHNIELFNEMMIENFGNDTNVYVIPSNVNFDSQNGYKTKTYQPDKFDGTIEEVWSGDIHPNDKGALYIADTLYQSIYNLVLH